MWKKMGWLQAWRGNLSPGQRPWAIKSMAQEKQAALEADETYYLVAAIAAALHHRRLHKGESRL
jgi:Na+-transporting methylmalonyl-CoA/oxaloacetate decarboxylase gamma subunit